MYQGVLLNNYLLNRSLWHNLQGLAQSAQAEITALTTAPLAPLLVVYFGYLLASNRIFTLAQPSRGAYALLVVLSLGLAVSHGWGVYYPSDTYFLPTWLGLTLLALLSYRLTLRWSKSTSPSSATASHSTPQPPTEQP